MRITDTFNPLLHLLFPIRHGASYNHGLHLLLFSFQFDVRAFTQRRLNLSSAVPYGLEKLAGRPSCLGEPSVSLYKQYIDLNSTTHVAESD